MKRKLALCLVGCLLATSLVACNKSEETTTQTTEAVVEETTEEVTEESTEEVEAETEQVEAETEETESAISVDVLEGIWNGVSDVNYLVNVNIEFQPDELDAETKDIYLGLGYTEEQLALPTTLVLNHSVAWTNDLVEEIVDLDTTFYGELTKSSNINIYDNVNKIKYTSGDGIAINGKDGYKEELEVTKSLPALVLVDGADGYTTETVGSDIVLTGEFDVEALFGLSALDLGLDAVEDVLVKVYLDENGLFQTANIVVTDELLESIGYADYDVNMGVLDMNSSYTVEIPEYFNNYDFK